jgi:methionyl-tRNA formyltransferase
MKIEFLTQDDPLYVFPFFDEFVRCYGSEFEILQISTSPTMGNRSRTQMLKELTELYGPVGLSRLVGRVGAAKILGTLPKAKDAGRFHTLSQLCRAYGIPHKSIDSPNAPEFVDSVRRRAPDVVVSVACPFILKEPLLAIPWLGAINIHHAPLPRYRGMMPTFWQMFHGERTVGVTIHRMAAKVDEGCALFQGQLAIEPGERLDSLIRRSKRHGAHCMIKVLRQLSGSCCPDLSQLDGKSGTYFTFPTHEQIQDFRRRGFRAI